MTNPELNQPNLDTEESPEVRKWDIGSLPDLTFAAFYDQKDDPEIVDSFVVHEGGYYYVLRIDDGSLVRYPVNRQLIV